VFSIYLCIGICVIIWIINGIWLIQATREYIISEIFMHTGLGIFFSVLVIELTIGSSETWTHFGISWLAVIGWILYLPAAILVFGSMVELKTKGKANISDFTATTSFINKGLYSCIRQPMTLGMAIWSIALILVFQSILTIILGLVSALCFWMAARKESDHNIKKFGNAYIEYVKKVPMWNVLRRLRK